MMYIISYDDYKLYETEDGGEYNALKFDGERESKFNKLITIEFTNHELSNLHM